MEMKGESTTLGDAVDDFVQGLRDNGSIESDVGLERFFAVGEQKFAHGIMPEKIYILLNNGTWGTVEINPPIIQTPGTMQ